MAKKRECVEWAPVYTITKEVGEYLEKEHPDWPRVLTARHINAPADYWPQKVLAVSSSNRDRKEAVKKPNFPMRNGTARPSPSPCGPRRPLGLRLLTSRGRRPGKPTRRQSDSRDCGSGQTTASQSPLQGRESACLGAAGRCAAV